MSTDRDECVSQSEKHIFNEKQWMQSHIWLMKKLRMNEKLNESWMLSHKQDIYNTFSKAQGTLLRKIWKECKSWKIILKKGQRVLQYSHSDNELNATVLTYIVSA